MSIAAAGSDIAGRTTPFERAMITASVMLTTIMQAIDTTIANVALPHMQGTMSATPDQISWVLTSYIVAAAIMTPPTGILAARLGRRRLFIIMVIGFTLASMLCGAATSLTEIVLFRVMQGIFGAGLVPLSQAILLDTYPTEKHGSAMAIWGMGVMVGPILGPTIGGFVTEYYNWRWVFYINLPVGILALVGIITFVPETVRNRARQFDYFGFALLSLAIGALQLMLDRGESQEWFASNEIIIYATISGLCFYTFLVHMFTARAPFIESGLFRDRNFSVGLVLIFIIGIILLATMALLPPLLQNLAGYPALTTGYVLAPRGIGTMVVMIFIGRVIGRVDTRILILTGTLLTAYSLYEMSRFTLDVSVHEVVWTGVVQGVGLGFIYVPLTTLTFSTLAAHYRNDGTAMFSLIRNLGSSIGIAMVFTILSRHTQANHAAIADQMTPFRDALQAPFLPGSWNWHLPTGLAALNEEVTRQAAMIAFLNDFTLMMWLSLASVPLLLLLKSDVKTRPANAGPAE